MLEYPRQFNITQSELAPVVADYFDNLLVQRDAILEKYQLTPETAEKFCDLQSSGEDREKILALYEHMVYVLEHKQIPPGEKMLNYVVFDALNPYTDAFKKAGLPEDHPLCLEQKEMTLDIPEIIAFQTKLYREQDMDVWADDIEQNINELMEILSTPEEQEKIKTRIKAGYIPIIMPGRAVQFETWETALNNLKPVYIEDGDPLDINEPYIYQGYQEKMTDPTTDPQNSCLRATPERPYLVWTQPINDLRETDIEWKTTNLSYNDQVIKLKTLHTDYPELCDERDMHPLEYAALQSLATHTIEQKSIEEGYEPTSLKPLDYETYTRFIGSLSDGGVLRSYFHLGLSQLCFDGDGVGARVQCGFRPAARS